MSILDTPDGQRVVAQLAAFRASLPADWIEDWEDPSMDVYDEVYGTMTLEEAVTEILKKEKQNDPD